jgi:hypothetical protein
MFMGIVIFLALIYVRFVFRAPVDHDEVEHMHVAFKILNGQAPYRDFYQNHWPVFWLLCMPFVKAFPFSTNAILAVRGMNLLMLAGCWLLGLGLLRSIRGGLTWFSLAIYSYIMIILAYEMDWHLMRPDPLMVLFSTAGLFFIPVKGPLSYRRALLLGLLFGLSVSVSIKMIPMMLIVPALILLRHIGDRKLQSVMVVFPYGLGVLLGLLPVVLWVFHNGLLNAFFFDVFDLNRAISKSWWGSWRLFRFMIFPISVCGAWVLWRTYKRSRDRNINVPPVLALSLAAGSALFFLARHKGLANRQVLMVPLAIGAVSLFLYLCLHLRNRKYQLLGCAALLGFSICDAGVSKAKITTISLYEMQEIMNLAKPGGRTCTAFSPAHPLFCRDISGLSNTWDLNFPQRIRDPQQFERFHRLWHDGIQRTLDLQPDILLRRAQRNIWEEAVIKGLITQDELKALGRLRSFYDVRQIGVNEFWIKNPIGNNASFPGIYTLAPGAGGAVGAIAWGGAPQRGAQPQAYEAHDIISSGGAADLKK